MITDTPETDALFTGCSGYPHPMEGIDLARKLERELNELRLQAKWHDEADALRRLREREKEHLREAVLSLYNEVNCRLQHGAESNGHLTYVEQRLKEILYP